MAAELHRDQAQQEHQDIDAHRLQGDVLGQQLEQHAVEGAGKQGRYQDVGQVPEVRPLAQRDEQEQVVHEHGEQHAVEGAVQPHQVFLGRRAGAMGAEVQRYEDGAAALHPHQQGIAAGRQLDGEPEVAHLHRALGEGKAVTALLAVQAAILVLQVQVDAIEQGVVDLQIAGERLRAAVDQADLEPPHRVVLAQVGVVAGDRGKGAVRQAPNFIGAQAALAVLVVTHVGGQGQAQFVTVQRCRGERP